MFLGVASLTRPKKFFRMCKTFITFVFDVRCEISYLNNPKTAETMVSRVLKKSAHIF